MTNDTTLLDTLYSVPAVLGSIFQEHSLTLVVVVVLLGLSATFSGCETSLFSLSAPELNRFRASKRRIDGIVIFLHSNLKNLLPSILFCNMAVNVLVFALTAAIAADLGAAYGPGAAFLCSIVNLLTVVFFGEVFPKQFAISSSFLVARLTCFQVWMFYRLVGRPMRVLNAVVVGLERVFGADRASATRLREEELKLLVELSKNDGVISDGEYELIDGIVELPEVRIRDIMVPKIDVATLSQDDSVEDALATARHCNHCKLPVLDIQHDDVAGWVDVRDIYQESHADAQGGETSIAGYIRDIRFFSEHDRADQVMETIKGEVGGDLFAVVDERGQVTGFFTMQDIMDEILGHFGEDGAPPPSDVRAVDGRYIISGRLSIREWRELFNVPGIIPRNATTVGGLVVALLGRMAVPGDKVSLDNMEMTVLATWHHRVSQVALRLIEPAAPVDEREERP